jgi:hypothetical protein
MRKGLGSIQAADSSAAGRRGDRAVGLHKHAENIPRAHIAVHVRVDAGKRLSATPIVRRPKHTLSYLLIGLIFDRARQSLLVLFPRSIHVANWRPIVESNS